MSGGKPDAVPATALARGSALVQRLRPNVIRDWMPTALPALGISGLVLAYVALNLSRLGAESFWTDELMSVGPTNEALPRMLRMIAGDWHPPLYSSEVWLWIRLTGTATEAVVRFVSLIAIAVGFAALGLAAWRRIGLGAAAIVMALALSSTLVASFAREARPHGPAFGMACLTTAAWLFVLGSRRLRFRELAVFAIVGGLAALTSYYAGLVYTLEVAVVLGWLGLGRRWRESRVTLALTGLSVLPAGLWLFVSWHALGHSSTPALDQTWAEEVAGRLAEPFTSAVFQPGLDTRQGITLVLAVLAIAGAGFLVGGARVLRSARRGDPPQWTGSLGRGSAALLVGVLAVGVAVLESLALSPSFHYRSLVSVLPVLYVGLAAGVTVAFGRLAAAVGLSVALLLGGVALATPEPGQWTKDDWREAGAIIVQEVRAGLPADRVAIVDAMSIWGTRIDWIQNLNNAVGRPAPAVGVASEVADVNWISNSEDLTALPADQPLLLVAFHYWLPDRHAAIVEMTHERFGPCEDRSVPGITVLECQPSMDPARL